MFSNNIHRHYCSKMLRYFCFLIFDNVAKADPFLWPRYWKMALFTKCALKKLKSFERIQKFYRWTPSQKGSLQSWKVQVKHSRRIQTPVIQSFIYWRLTSQTNHSPNFFLRVIHTPLLRLVIHASMNIYIWWLVRFKEVQF